MPLDQSDRIRRLQEIKTFQGWAVQQNTIQPNVNISSCVVYNSSETIKQFNTYQYGQLVEAGRPLFSTCQSTQ
jgi:hypothetical protein